MSLRSEVIRIVNELLGNSRKISELPAASALTGTEQVELNQGGASVRTTTQDIADLGSGGGGSQNLQQVLTTGSVLTTSNFIDVPGGEELLIESDNVTTPSRVKLNGGAGEVEFSAAALVNLSAFNGTVTTNLQVRPTFINLTGMTAGLQINNDAGTAGQVITSNGPAAAPTWEDSSGSSALTLNNHWIGNSSNVATEFPLYYVIPEQYGAVGDGATDDSTAINNAIASGLPVRFGNKNYRIATTLTTTDDTYLFGGGSDCIISVASNISIITVGGINGTIENLQLLGSGSGAAQNGITAVGNGSFNLYRYGTKVINVFFNDLGNAGMYTINTIGNSSGSEHQGTYFAVNCRATSCSVGYLMDTRGEYNVFTNCLADNCTTGVRFNGGNNSWTGGNIVDNTTNVVIGSGTNDGHGVITGAKINHGGSNVTCTSTATGFAFVGCEIVAGSITLTSCTDIRFYNCDIASAAVTSTNAVGTVFYGNCFRTTPSITVAAGNNPIFVFNTFPAASTVHSLIVNTVQGGISQTQQGPTSPNTLTGTWTTTASGQFHTQINGTITPRATTSDLTRALIVDVSHTQTANSQIFYAADLQPTATISAGGFTATQNGALRTRGRVRLVDLTTTGAVTGTSGFTYEKSNGDLIFQWSPDAIFRIGNAGSPWQITSTSDGLVANNNGNGGLISAGPIGVNINANNTGAGTVNARGIGIIGGSSITSGTTEYAALRIIPTYNQTGTATGDVLGIDYNPTLTAVLGNHYFIRNRSIAANSAFAMAAAPTAKIHIGAGTTAANSGQIKLEDGVDPTAAENGLINRVGSDIHFTAGGVVHTLAKTLTATATLNFDLTAVNYQDLTITVTGAADGDAVSIGVPNGAVVADVTYFGWVSGANTVSIRCSRVGGGGAADPASGTFRASVIKY